MEALREITDETRRNRILAIIDAEPDRLSRIRLANGRGYLTWWVREPIFFVGRLWGRHVATPDGFRAVADFAKQQGCSCIGTNPQGVGRIIVRKFGFLVGSDGWWYKQI